MTPTRLGIVTPVVRRIPGAGDPLSWYRAVSADGATPHTQLLESADHTPGGTTRSLIGVRSAVHLTADRTTVTVAPTSPNGPAAIAWLAERRPDGRTDSAGIFRLAIPAGGPDPAGGTGSANRPPSISSGSWPARSNSPAPRRGSAIS